MTDSRPQSVYAAVTEKWRSLAARREAYFVQLYDSGRWRLYYTKESFVVAMRQVVAATRAWDNIARTNLPCADPCVDRPRENVTLPGPSLEHRLDV